MSDCCSYESNLSYYVAQSARVLQQAGWGGIKAEKLALIREILCHYIYCSAG